MADFDHSNLPDPHEALSSRRASHGRVLDAQATALKAQAQVDSEHVAQQRFEMQRGNLELNRVKALADIARQSVLIQQQMKAQEHTTNAIEALGSLSPSDPKYPLKMAEVFKNNPMAAQDPVVQAVVKSHIASRQVAEVSASHVEQIKQDEATRLAAWKARREEEDAAAKVLRDAPENAGMTPAQMTAKSAGGSVTLRNGTAQDPLKQAAAVRGQITSHETQLRDLNKNVDDMLEKNRWLKDTTGEFTDPKSKVTYFGNSKPGDAADNMTVATPATRATYADYTQALKRRSDLSNNLPKLNERLDALLNGSATPEAAAPSVPAVKWTRDSDGNPIPVK